MWQILHLASPHAVVATQPHIPHVVFPYISHDGVVTYT